MKITDDILMAYVDNELDPERSAEVERALKSDAALAARLDEHRALRRRVKSEFDPIMDEPIPDRLAALIVGAPSANVADLAAIRAQKKPSQAKQVPSRSWVRMIAPIAASVAFGVLIGYLSFKGGLGTTQIVNTEGAIINGTLLQALNKGLASKPELARDVQLGLSYLAKSGEYCRSFRLTGGDNLAGIACHAANAPADAWRIRVLTKAPEMAGGAIRTAASAIPKEVIDIANAEMNGDALDAEQEARMADQGWKN